MAILAPRLCGASFLDLYAGVGSVGLEAWRHGAARVVFVEKVASTVRVLRQNVAAEHAQAEIFQRDAVSALRQLHGHTFDIVFLDPPYGMGEVPRCLEALAASSLLAPAATVVAEHHHKDPVPETIGPLHLTRVQKYGETVLSFYVRPAE